MSGSDWIFLLLTPSEAVEKRLLVDGWMDGWKDGWQVLVLLVPRGRRRGKTQRVPLVHRRSSCRLDYASVPCLERIVARGGPVLEGGAAGASLLLHV